MIASAVFFALVCQGKLAPVSATQLVSRSSLCLLVTPSQKDSKVRVTRVLWGSGLKPGDRIRLRGYVYRDYTGGPNRGAESDFMTYEVRERSIVFLQPAPSGANLASDERFTQLPMLPFAESRSDCSLVDGQLMVGKVFFSTSMKRAHAQSVSLDEVTAELKRIRLAQG